MWQMLTEEKASPRDEFVVNMDELSPYISIRSNEWKYISGRVSYGNYDQWYGEARIDTTRYEPSDVLFSKACMAITGYITEKQMIEKRDNNGSFNLARSPLHPDDITALRNSAMVNCTKSVNDCNPMQSPCLFNILEDPCETTNLASEKSVLMASLQDLVDKYQATVVNATNLPADPGADPALFGKVWSNWRDDPRPPTLSEKHMTALYVVMVLCIVLGFAIAIAFCLRVRKMKCYKSSRSNSFSKNTGNAFFRTSSLDSQRRISHAREAAMTPSITVAQRVEMFEDRDNYKTRI